MNKRLIAVIVALLLVLIVICVAITLDRSAISDDANVASAPETAETMESTIVEETEESTEEITTPGVEDSIFDEEDEQTTEATTVENQEIKKPNNNRKPNDSQGNSENTSDNHSGSNQQGSSGDSIQPEIDANKPTEAPEQQPTAPPEKPTEPTEKPDEGNFAPGYMSYEHYQSMSPGEQQDYMDSFSSIDAFFAWYNDAKAKHEEEHPPIDVGDGSIDLEDVIGGD